MADLEQKLLVDGQAVRMYRELLGLTQLEVADKAHISKGSVGHAEGSRPGSRYRMTKTVLDDIAAVLGVKTECLTAKPDLVAEAVLNGGQSVPGTPEYYAKAVVGRWLAICRDHPGKCYRGRTVPATKSEWKVELGRDGGGIVGNCECQTSGMRHQKFALRGTVSGRGFVFIDGTRDDTDGADHMFRGLLQFHSDGISKIMAGGYVVYDVRYRAIFVGEMTLSCDGGPHAERG